MRQLRRVLLVALFASAAVAGCVAPVDPGDGAGAFASHPYRRVAIVAVGLPDGVTVGTASHWDLRVENRAPPGEEPFVYSSICTPPWEFALAGPDGRPVSWTEPMAQCEAYGEAVLEGGDSRDTRWSWSGRLWDAGDEAYHDAPVGTYVLTVTFHSIGEPDNGAGPTATHRVQVSA